MPQKSYMPPTEDGIAIMLGKFDDNIVPLQGKYGLLSADLLRVHQARLAWNWFLACSTAGQQWTESVIGKKKQWHQSPLFASQPMPVGPVLPAVPQIDLGAGLVNIVWEPNFFVYFSSLVARIKGTQSYDKPDGDLLGIEGPAILPPEPTVSPNLKVGIGTGGMPELIVTKGVFDGYDFQFKVGDGPVQKGSFVSKRRFLHQITLPGPGQAVLYSYCAQYRYKSEPFGQNCAWVTISVHG